GGEAQGPGAQHQVDPGEIAQGQVDAVVDVEEHVEVVRPDAQAGGRGAERGAAGRPPGPEQDPEEPDEPVHSAAGSKAATTSRQNPTTSQFPYWLKPSRTTTRSWDGKMATLCPSWPSMKSASRGRSG